MDEDYQYAAANDEEEDEVERLYEAEALFRFSHGRALDRVRGGRGSNSNHINNNGERGMSAYGLDQNNRDWSAELDDLIERRRRRASRDNNQEENSSAAGVGE